MALSPAPCPPTDVLEGVAIGGAESPALRDHLAACEACQHELQRMREDNRFLSGFVVNGALPVPAPAEAPVHVEIPGYEIVREIHRGGQGVVYEAVQRSTKRAVAIKVMKQGPFATLADRARFEREIETLGKLEHPNIVAVHDAGVVAGFHYFVMNYIEGLPLDEAIRPAGAVAALDAFVKVCDAVHAAHLRGIIHRDLKPSNIRVDPTGQPYVLDFGLAKAIDAQPDSAMTQTGQFVGSLPWAAPEQVEGVSSKIDLRTDVYSLGAILFQLLTGAVPFDVGSNLRDALDDILGREPPRPSALARAAGPGAAGRIDDELDTIVLKCLSKDRERRYQSAGELARDLKRYLADEPIEAKRDSAWYVIRKAAWRKRGVLLALSVPALLLPIAAVALFRSASAAREAAQERSLREVEAVRNAAMLEITRRSQARPGSAPDSPGGRLNSLNTAAIHTDLDTGSLSVSDYGVALLLAETLRDQGSTEAIVEAEGLVRQAMYMLRSDQGPRHPEIGRMRTILADMLLRRGSRMPEAEQMAELAVEELTSAFGQSSPETARGRIMLARIRLARGDKSGAMNAAREALAANFEPGSISRVEAQATIAAVHAERGEREDARHAYLESMRAMLSLTHDTDARVLDTLELGASLVARGVVPAEALLDPVCWRGALAEMRPEAALREVAVMLRGGTDGTARDGNYVPARFVMISLRERLLGPTDPSLGASLASAASSLLDAVHQSPQYNASLTEETEALLRRAIPLQITAQGPDSPLVGKSYEKLATCLVVACRLREATQWFALDCDLWTRQPAELRDEYQIMVRARWTAWHAARANDYELGLHWSDRALDLVSRTLGPDHGATALMQACRSVSLAGLKRMDESLECETRALHILGRQPVPEDQRSECRRFLGLARVLSKRFDDARTFIEPEWQSAQSKLDRAPGILEWSRTMLTYYRGIGDHARAEPLERYIREHGRGDISSAAEDRP